MRRVANFIAPTFAYQCRRAGGKITVFTYFMSPDLPLLPYAVPRVKCARSKKIKDLACVSFQSIVTHGILSLSRNTESGAWERKPGRKR